jgi:hypothetical protein
MDSYLRLKSSFLSTFSSVRYDAAIAFDESLLFAAQLPKAMQDAATANVKEILVHGILEFSQGVYRRRYFIVVKKKSGEYRFINNVEPLNKIIRCDSGTPSLDQFSEGYAITSTIDYFSTVSPRQVLSRSYGLT